MIGRVTIPLAERADYARLAIAEAERLDAIADVMDEFDFLRQLAFETRCQAGEHRDMASQARQSLGVDGLLLA